MARSFAGFAVFFSLFEITRGVAAKTRSASQEIVSSSSNRTSESLRRHVPRLVHATTLVAGGAIAGLAYELTCRPWDMARKAVHVDRLSSTSERHSLVVILLRKLREDGLLSYFKDPNHVSHHEDLSTPLLRRRLYSASRTLARVGPWGIGFLVWEAFGPGIS